MDYVFDLEPMEFQDFKDLLRDIFTDADKCFFLNTVALFRFTRLESNDDFDYVAFIGKAMVRGTVTERSEVKYETYMEMLADIREWFPAIDPETLRAALYNYDHKKERNEDD